MKLDVQRSSRKLLLVLFVIGAYLPVESVHAVTILPAPHNGSTVWTGNNPLELDAAAIGTITGQSGLVSFYETGFGNAQLTTSGSPASQIVFTAKEAGSGGNDISINIVDSAGPNAPLSVSVSGRTITVSLGTDAGGAATSTAAQVAAAINAHPSAASLVTASGAGSGVVVAQSTTTLAPVITEAGPFAGSYATTFANSSSFPQDADLSYGSGAVIAATSLFLYVRDTAQVPAFYIFDLLAPATNWNAFDDLYLQGFWPDDGAIQQIKIVGIAATTSVPEGSSLALLALGMGMLGLFRRASNRHLDELFAGH